MNGHKDDNNDLPEALENFTNMILRGNTTFEGNVEAVDEEKFTATIKTNESTYYEVPLRVLVSAQASVVEIPKLQTPVILCFRHNNLQQPQILAIHEADKLLIKTPLTKFNDGLLGGMVKARELKAQSEKDEAVLNGLLNVINGPAINEPGNGAPSAFQIALKAALAGKQPGEWDNLENDKILQ